jgi:hypothetical protein
VVDGTGLENRHTRKGIGGSNPSLSAITLGYLVLASWCLRLWKCNQQQRFHLSMLRFQIVHDASSSKPCGRALRV